MRGKESFLNGRHFSVMVGDDLGFDLFPFRIRRQILHDWQQQCHPMFAWLEGQRPDALAEGSLTLPPAAKRGFYASVTSKSPRPSVPTLNTGRFRRAGPAVTLPFPSNVEPWQGQ